MFDIQLWFEPTYPFSKKFFKRLLFWLHWYATVIGTLILLGIVLLAIVGTLALGLIDGK